MSYNISHIDTLSSTLRISRDNADKAREIDDMPEGTNLDVLQFGDDGYAPIPRFWFYGEGSGRAYDEAFDDYVALIEGDADLILFWEGGNSVEGVRIRDGIAFVCDVIMTLGPVVDDSDDEPTA